MKTQRLEKTAVNQLVKYPYGKKIYNVEKFDYGYGCYGYGYYCFLKDNKDNIRLESLFKVVVLID